MSVLGRGQHNRLPVIGATHLGSGETDRPRAAGKADTDIKEQYGVGTAA